MASAARRLVPVVGLEVHVQLTSRSKLFSSAAAGAAAAIGPRISTSTGDTNAQKNNQDALQYGWALQRASAPNVRVSSFDAALPGTLPRVNEECVKRGVRLGLALGGTVNLKSRFERKHYFYADLPHGYQITQQQHPIVSGGGVTIRVHGKGPRRRDGSNVEEKFVRVNRLQLETDSGKSVHAVDDGARSHIDLNRAGVGLIEIVSEPDMCSSNEAASFVKTIQGLVRHIGVSTANIDEGELRCDVNVSLRDEADPHFSSPRCEVKNVNGPRFVAKAIEYEILRQSEIILAGNRVESETRTFDASTGRTTSLRSKEQELDYRFMPEPDLPPLHLSQAFVDRCKSTMVELPDAIRERFEVEYGFAATDVDVILEAGLGSMCELVVELVQPAGVPADKVASLFVNRIMGIMNEKGGDLPAMPSAEILAELLRLQHGNRISTAGVRDLLPAIFNQASTILSVETLAREAGCIMDDSTAGSIRGLCVEAIARLPSAADAYRAGDRRVLRRLVGEVMKATSGACNPNDVTAQLERLLAEDGK